MSGWWDQLDEVEALQSIYGEERFTFHVDGVLGDGEEEVEVSQIERLRGLEQVPHAWRITCQIDIDVEVPCEGIGISRSDERVAGNAVVATIQHLPPVRVEVCMQPGYPDHLSPIFGVSSCWLGDSMTDRIEEDLNAWELDGSPILFACCEHVRCMLVESGGDLQSIQVPSDDAVRLLLQYTSAREDDLFTDGMHTCNICYEELPGSRFTVLHCGHYFCTSCLQSQLQISITEGDVESIRCADVDCRDMLEPHEVQILVDTDMFERWQDITLNKFLSAMPDAAYCPRCSSVSIEDSEDNSADCPKCFFVFCTLCEEGRHPGIECVGPETKLEILRKKAAGGGRSAIADLRRKEQEYQSLIEIRKTSKSCPACGMAIHKVQGCNKMICASCGCFFCYKCGADISDVGYDHYKDGKNCVLFDHQEILRWERQWELMGGQEQPPEAALAPQQHHSRTYCPNCGQCNLRIAENNHIHCWSCAQYYCSRCRQILPRRRSGAHFGRGGCPQHG